MSVPVCFCWFVDYTFCGNDTYYILSEAVTRTLAFGYTHAQAASVCASNFLTLPIAMGSLPTCLENFILSVNAAHKLNASFWLSDCNSSHCRYVPKISDMPITGYMDSNVNTNFPLVVCQTGKYIRLLKATCRFESCFCYSCGFVAFETTWSTGMMAIG